MQIVIYKQKSYRILKANFYKFQSNKNDNNERLLQRKEQYRTSIYQ